MKKSFFDKWLLILVLAFTANQSKAQVLINAVDSLSLYSYQWIVFWMRDVNLYKEDLSSSPNLLFHRGEPGKVVGESGCHDLECDFTISGKANIRFFNLSFELYECETDVDSRFLKVLGKAKRYKIRHHELRLYGDDGLLVKFYPHFSEMAFNTTTALEGEWYLDYLLADNLNIDLDRSFPDSLPSITFASTSPGTITGWSGCNSFSSIFSKQPSSFKFHSPMNTTMSVCQGHGEEAFLNTLPAITSNSVSDELLYFWQGNTCAMIFKRKQSVLMERGASVRFRERKIKGIIYGCGNQ